MRFRSRTLRLMCLFLMPSVVPFAAETTDTPSPLPKTMAVAAFKNGLAFTIRQGEVSLAGGVGRISPIPNATLGTLWLSTNSQGSRIDEVTAYRFNIPEERPIPSIGEILQANAGKTVTVTYQMKDYTGEVIGLREPHEDAKNPAVAQDPGVEARSNYLLLRANKGIMAFPLDQITMAALPEDAILREPVNRPGQGLRFSVKGGPARQSLTMGYLEHGIGWTPSYLISLADDTNAQITMQSVVTNDAEDIQDADLFFVVGVPNFAYASAPSPMSLQQSLMEFMRDAERATDKKAVGAFSNALQSQMVAIDEVAGAAPIQLTPSVEDSAGAPEEDLFLYSRSGVTLAKGERASYNIFSGNVSYEHIYDWEVEEQSRVDAFGNVINPNVPDGNRADSVWHAIRLKNTTKFPWTSAPALVISGDKPVSQDTLSYTPKGASSTLKITVATDIRASHEEREVARQQNILHRTNLNYDLVTVEGKLKVMNYKTKDVRLSIAKTLRGKVESQSDDGKLVQMAEGLQGDNPRTRLTWEMTLKPGEQRVVTYSYKIWVRI